MKMILDLDTGIDDALALAYALGSDEVELIGVVGSYGNVTVDQGIVNTLALLELLGYKNVPVYRGASCPSTKNEFNVREICKFIHGRNGIGDIELTNINSVKEEQNGVEFILESVSKYGKDLTIVATGPLTNLAAAMKKDPSMKDRIGNVVIMGGALTVPGNVTPCAEANIHEDVEAANYVFTSGLRFTMVGLDVTHRTILTKEETMKLRKINSTSSNIYANMADYYIDVYKQLNKKMEGCALHDPLAVAVAINKELVQTIPLHMIVNIEGNERGRTTGDKDRLTEPNPPVQAAIGVKSEEFKREFMERLIKLFKEN